MNSVQLLGRLTRDPDVRYTDGGSTVAKFTLAVNRMKSADGEQSADFINCVAFGKTAENAERNLHKGKQIIVNGRIQTGSYTNNDGIKVYTTDIVVEKMFFVGSKNEDSSSNITSAAPALNGDFMSIPDGIDEELPF